jgi:toxin ParE1/3/4
VAEYVLSPLAQKDIDEIWDYTAERWGLSQADNYVSEIRGAIELLVEEPRRGRPCGEVLPRYRKYPAGSHMIFFRPTQEGLVVVRVLHQSMDYEKHLRGPE